MRNMNARLYYILLQTTLPHIMMISAWDNTAILVKQHTDFNNNDSQMINGKHFLELIQSSKIWVDKSLLIKAIWDQIAAKVIMHVCPRRWGKTINLEMIQFYHQMPIDKYGEQLGREDAQNYLYFVKGKIWDGQAWQETEEPPLISKHFDYFHYLGNCSVITLNGANLTARDDKMTTLMFANMVFNAYRDHSYLEDYLKKKSQSDPLACNDLMRFEKFYYGSFHNNLSIYEYTDSISTLSNILHKTYDRPVIILFDDYDGIIVDTYFRGTILPDNVALNSYFMFFDIFMGETFKHNHHFKKAIITGVLPIRQFTGDFSQMNNVELQSVFGFTLTDLYPFYGVFEAEFDKMADLRKINKSTISTAKERYNGYRTLSHLNSPMFAPLSAICFINTLKIEDYWASSSEGEIIPQLFKHPDFLQYVKVLLRNWQSSDLLISYEKFVSFIPSDYETIFKLKNNAIKYRPEHHRYIFPLLLCMGYVSINPNTKVSDDYLKRIVKMKIPNLEIYHQYKNYFISFLGSTVTDHDFITALEEDFMK